MKKIIVDIQKAKTSPASKIFIINCMPDNEQGAVRRREELINDVVNEVYATDATEAFRKPAIKLRATEKRSFGESIKTICSMGAQGCTPHVFIDGHGSKSKGLNLAKLPRQQKANLQYLGNFVIHFP